MATFGEPADLSNDEVLEGKAFWEGRVVHFIRENEPDAVATARAAVEEFTAEARKRGLL